MGASAPYCPIPSDQSTQILSVKLVRKADSFTSEGALFRQGDRLSRSRPTPLVVSRAERIDTNGFESMKVRERPTQLDADLCA